MYKMISRVRGTMIGALLASAVMIPVGTATAAGSPEGLRIHEGNYYVETPGAVIEGVEIRGRLIVKANNITIRNTRVVGSLRAATVDTLIDVGRGTTGVTIQDTTVRAAITSEWAQGIRGSGFTAERVDISNVTDGVMVIGSNVAVRDSTIHDLYIGPSSYHYDGTTHTDSIQVEGGTNIVIERNVLAGSNTAAVMVTQNASKVSSLVIRGNNFRDGSCTINLDEKGKGPFVGFSITNNVFGPTYNGNKCPMRLPASSPKIALSGNTLVNGAAATPWWN